ncbi:bola protein [Haematococcus lacustris]
MLRRAFSSATRIVAVGEAEQAIAAKLAASFAAAKAISVQDTSGGCGAMYNIIVESDDFKGKSIIQQHQAVHRVLKEDIAKWHALNLVTRVPTDS